jgi:hypothetical protein
MVRMVRKDSWAVAGHSGFGTAPSLWSLRPREDFFTKKHEV